MNAFQSALGFGGITNGGNGFATRVVRSVTDIQTALNDGPGKVIVQAGGTLDERSTGGILTLPSSVTLVADPSYGGIIVRGTVQAIGKVDVIVRNFTFAPGLGQPIPTMQTDAATMGSGAARIIFDYCRFMFSIDECIGLGFNCSDITVMRSIVAWGLRNAGHPDGEHSKAVMNAHSGVFRATYYLCGLFNCNDRNIRCLNDGDIEIINCLVVNYGVGTHLADGAMGTPTRLHFIGNNYLPGPNTPSGRKALVGDPASVRARVYVRDNRGPGRENGTGDEWLITNLPTSKRSLTPMFTSLIPDSAIRPSSAITLDLLTEIGTKPWDALTQKLIADGTQGAWIDNPDEVGGYPIVVNIPQLDSDSDGIPDTREGQFTDVLDYLEADLTGTLPPIDTEPPVVHIVFPRPNLNVFVSKITIAGSCMDNVNVKQILIKARGVPLTTITEPGSTWTFAWTISNGFTNGECFITAEATDDSGNVSTDVVRIVLKRPGHAVED